MAGIPFLHNIDLNNHQLLNAKLHPSDSAPSSPGIGTIWYDTGNDLVKIYDNTATGNVGGWNTITGDITGVSITAGDGLSGTVATTAGAHTQTLLIDISGYSDVTPANGDKLLTLDSDGSTEQLTTIAALASLFAGSGLTATDSVIAVDTLNQDTTGTAAIATTVTVADESSDTTCFPLFATAATGNLAPKSGTNLTFDSDTGNLSATLLTGTLQTAAQTNITSLGTLTALTVDNVVIDGAVIGHTGDTDLITLSSGVVTVAGEVDATSLDVSGDIDVDGTSNLDNTDIDGTLAVDGATISLDATTSLNIDNSNTSNGITIGTATSGVPITIGHTTSETTIQDNLTVTGDLKVSGSTVTQNVSTVTIKDPIIALGTADDGAAPGSDDNKDRGLAMHYHTGSAAKIAFLGFDDDAGDLTFIPDATISSEVVSGTKGTINAHLDGNVTGTILTASQTNITAVGTLSTLTVDNVIINGTTIGHTGDTDLMTLASGVLTVAGEVDATSLDISGDADIDGTLEADAITVNGTALNTVIDNRIKVVQKTATIDVSELHNTALKCNIAHGMTSNNLIVKLYDGTTFLDVFADIDRTDNNTLQITFASEPTNDIVVIIQEIIGDNIAAGSDITYPSS